MNRHTFNLIFSIGTLLAALVLVIMGCIGDQIEPTAPIICQQPDENFDIDLADSLQVMLVGGYLQLPGMGRWDSACGCVDEFYMINNSSNCCPNLEGIDRYPGIKSLYIANLDESPAGIVETLDFSPVGNLSELDTLMIVRSIHITELDLTPLGSCPNLKYLVITNTSSATGFRKIILPQSNSLETLHILNNHELTQIELNSCPALTEVVINGNKKLATTPFDLNRLGPLPELKTLSFVHSQVSQFVLGPMPLLSDMVIKNHYLITELDLSPLSGSSEISSVDIGFMDVAALNLDPLAGKPHLKTLSLKGMKQASDGGTANIREFLHSFATELPDLDSLQTLSLSQLGITEIEIPDLENLLTLSLSTLPYLGELELPDTDAFHSLRTLSLSDLNGITSLEIPQYNRLRTLSITGIGLLTQLNLTNNYPALTTLTISGMLDESADPLEKYWPSHLRRLNISGIGASRYLQTLTIEDCPELTNFIWPSYDHLTIEEIKNVTFYHCSHCAGSGIRSDIEDFVTTLAALTRSLEKVDLGGNCFDDFDVRPLLYQPQIKLINLECNMFWDINMGYYSRFCPDDSLAWEDWEQEFVTDFGYVPGEFPYWITTMNDYGGHQVTVSYLNNPLVAEDCLRISTYMEESVCDSASLQLQLGTCYLDENLDILEAMGINARMLIESVCPRAPGD